MTATAAPPKAIDRTNGIGMTKRAEKEVAMAAELSATVLPAVRSVSTELWRGFRPAAKLSRNRETISRL
jgi:hypothetical protein